MIANIQLSYFLILLCSSYTLSRTITVVNKCSQTIWPVSHRKQSCVRGALLTDLYYRSLQGVYTGNAANGKPGGIAANGGFQLNAGASVSFTVPDTWTSARLWGRTGCDFSKQDVVSCSTGSCLGGMNCNQPGIPPVTLAEFTLAENVDHYDVSNVDGSNLPMSITGPGCATGSCPADLNPGCPGELQVKDGSGKIVGCYSSCKKLGGETNCCSGAHNTPQSCPSNGGESHLFVEARSGGAYFRYSLSGLLSLLQGSMSRLVRLCL